MSKDFITIGGIKFNSQEVNGYRKEDDNSRAGTLYTVETNQGIFTFRDWPNQSKQNCNNEPSIFGDKITNCKLESLIGTNEENFYKLSNSYINNVDISGDPKNIDTVTLDENSKIENAKIDKRDHIFHQSDMNTK